jgi:dinuclear metal center YbgI/SA1388 family protein
MLRNPSNRMHPMKIKEIVLALQQTAPLYLQESYDNSGLQIGDPEAEITSALITLDVQEAVIDEAIGMGAGLIIAHHPLIFNPIKQLTGRTHTERCVIKAIRSNIALLVLHTNLDHARFGLNYALARRLGISQPSVLMPGAGKLNKIVVYCPTEHAALVAEAMFAAGAGRLGNYDMCSFQHPGTGTFRALDGANPFVGTHNAVHSEDEQRIEMVMPADKKIQVVEAMKQAHPYEEVAFDVTALVNPDPTVGAGAYGSLDEPLDEHAFLNHVKSVLKSQHLRYTATSGKPIQRIGVCGGSGAFLIDQAVKAGLDAFITADIKYHQFFDAQDRILAIDAGHYETEIVMTGLIYDEMQKKFPTFACCISKQNTNPVKYS